MVLVERERELDLLAAHAARAGAGIGGALLIEGAAGIGKTALLDAAADLAAAHGLAVLRARAAELERELPFGIVRQLLEPSLAAASEQRRRLLLGGAAQLARAPLGLENDAASPSAALHGLYWLCANLADERPLLLAVDDLQWADEPSLRFLAYLARRAAEHPLLICATVRALPAREQGPLLAGFATTCGTVAGVRPLSAAGVEQVVRATVSDSAEREFCRACARATGGNPFLLNAALATLSADGVAPVAAAASRVERLRSASLSRALLGRLARLGADADRLARAVAVLGADAPLRRLAQLAGLELATAAAALDGLRREGLIAPAGPIEFVHPLVRTTVEADLGEPAGGLAHLRAARLLAADGVAADRIATHLLAAEPSADPWVAATLHAAGTAALARGAPEPAVALLTRALREPPAPTQRASIEADLGRAYGRTGALEAALATMERALGGEQDRHRRALLTLELAELAQLAGRASIALAPLDDARRALDADAADRTLELTARIAFAQHVALEPVAAWSGPLATLDAGEAATGRGWEVAQAALAYAAAGSGHEPATAVERRALARTVPEADWGAQVDGWHQVAVALAACGRVDPALALLDRAVASAQRLGDEARASFALLIRARTLVLAGRLHEAEADARTALGAYDDGAVSPRFACGVLTLVLVGRGALDAADEELARHGFATTREIASVPDFVLLQARGGLRLAQGRPLEARDDLRVCGATLERIDFGNPAFSDWRAGLALALLALGERDDARRLAVRQLELARAFGAAWAVGMSLRVAGLVQGGPRGLALLSEAAETLARTSAALERALALVDYGAALRRAGQRRAAREPLRAGLDGATRCGADALAERAREELVSAGARPRRAALSGPGALTPTELRVARLAAEGRTNREIAQALFVTRRTVEVHLTSAYRKLGIDSRDRLAAALGEPAREA